MVALLGQVGGGDFGAGGNFGGRSGAMPTGGNFGEPPAATTGDLGPRMSVSAGASTRSTRATASNPPTNTNPLQGSYPPARVATSPRYAGDPPAENGLPPVGDSSRVAQEDPLSALANKLLTELIQPSTGDQNVRALRLIDALERSSGSQQQFTAIKAYWDWTLAVSELHGVLEEDTILNRVPAPRTSHEQLAHSANVKASRSRLEDSQLDVAAKLVDLLEATSMRGVTTPLRPANVPFASTYNTNFSRIFPGNSAPQTLRKIHQTLPYALKVVRSRADSYSTARQATTAAEQAYQRGQGTYSDFVNALGLMRSQRRAFLDSVHDYNFAIAEYALSIAGPGLQRETVVSMLIRPTTGNTPYRGASTGGSGQVPGNILPASAIGGLDSAGWNTYHVSVPDEPASQRPALRPQVINRAAPIPVIGDFGNRPEWSTTMLR